jgi:hypothetical protein
MYHPLAEDPSTLSNDELQEKITLLNKKYLAASRFPDQTLLRQVHSMIIMYTDEQQKRYRKQFQDQKKQNDNDQDLGDLVNVD